ncbi:cytochrome P450 [Nostoc sp.]|uniref:cytochrome P450 n=1 Tax=Nostoc sp. TaxID=1180 RepID=UPI002FF95ACA
MKLPVAVKTPALLQLMHWAADPIDFCKTYSQRYGDIFTSNFNPTSTGFTPTVFTSNPQAIQEILTADPKLFSSQDNGIINHLVGDNSLFLMDSQRHKEQRKLLMPHFHGQRLIEIGDVIYKIAEKVSSELAIYKPFSVRQLMQEISLQLMIKVVFGISEDQRYQQLKQLILKKMAMIESPLSLSLLLFKFLQKDLGDWSPWGNFLRLQRQIAQLIDIEIQQRRSQPDIERRDILSMLMSARDEHGNAMSNVELHDQLITLLVAGYETVATGLSWALYWIYHQPRVRETLLCELDSLGENLDPTAISRLPYLSAVCQETLRISSPAMFAPTRLTTGNFNLMGYKLPPGTRLSISIFLTHHREDIYPQPQEFQPERFLQKQYSIYEYLPFGGGNRFCIGAALATLEMKLVLAVILSRRQLTLIGNELVHPVRHGPFVVPSNNFQLVITE